MPRDLAPVDAGSQPAPAGVPVPAAAEPPAASRGVRSRLARIGSTKIGSATPVLEPLFKVVRATHPKADLRALERAYEVAEACHRGQRRRSGDPYITHPLAVTTILAELGMTTPTLCAALLHDTVEDTTMTLATIAREFGDEVAERMRAVYVVPDGSAARVAAQTSLPPFPTGEVDTPDVVDRITASIYGVVATARRIHDDVDAADPTTADLLHTIIERLEQLAWMVDSENRVAGRSVPAPIVV